MVSKQNENEKNQKLKPFFNPGKVLICGASGSEGKFGYQIIKNLDILGYEGKIFLVNPHEEEILGKKTYKKISDVPETPDLAIVVLPPQKVMRSIETCIKFGIKHLMIESSFLTENMEKKLQRMAKENNVRIVGSNTIGIINFNNDFSTSIIPVRCIFKEGNIAYIAQSGGLAGGCGWWHPENGLGFSKIIHLGDACDVDESEVLDYLSIDENTDVILLFLKKIEQSLYEKIKKISKIKPILFLRPNKKSEINKISKCGAIPVDDYQDLFEIAKCFVQNPPFKGNKIGLVGPSSGALSLILSKMGDYEGKTPFLNRFS
jgi:acetyltransferase